MLNSNYANKILVLGVDGMDPRLTKKFMDQGKLPNIKKYVEAGAAKEDLVMLGAMPTITPPLWTTLATGAYPMTHGITCFWNQHPEKLDTLIYALDSRMCKAEQLWNVFAEAGNKTLVWHWPGSSWPPSSPSENLHVVDGTQPAAVNWGIAIIDWEKLLVATTDTEKVIYKPKATSDSGAGCILNDLDVADELGTGMLDNLDNSIMESTNIMFTHEEGDLAIDSVPFDIVNSPIRPAEGWNNAPEGALEFVIITSNGFMRRPALILKNDQGVYDRVAIYKSKKDTEAIIVLEEKVTSFDLVDDVLVGEEHKKGIRNVRVMEIAPDGTKVRFWMSCALDAERDDLFHPKSLFKSVVENVGLFGPPSVAGGKNTDICEDIVIPIWDHYVQWQAACINHLIKENDYDVVFSHVHNVDAMGHMFWYFAKEREDLGNDAARYQKFLESVYVQTDDYLGEFLPLLDEGWTILIVSDHGLLSSERPHSGIPLIGDPFGCNVMMMKELGYTALKKDASGNDLKEIDWENTKAVATRGNHIIINLKGRNIHGIVEPEDKYALEAEIISALYNYRLEGERVIAMALRNKDAAVVGLGGEECGDIIYFLEEGSNRVHGDSLSTTYGYFDTSVSPIFIAAGKGIKPGITNRIVRQVDFTPTIAVLGGVRMPDQCEGAPLYQILEKSE